MSYSEGGRSNGQITQTAYSYRPESFSVDSNMIWRSAVTRSDLMRVSQNWTPQLNILEILKHFWPAPEPCRQATIKDMDFIFPVRTLPSITCPPCKYEGMDMHSSSTVVCKSWGQFRWNLVIYGSKCLYSEGGPSNGQIYKRPIDTGLNHSGSISIWSGNIFLCSYKVWPYAGQSQLDATLEYSWNFKTFMTCNRSPVDRQPLMIWTLCFLCLPCPPLPSNNAVNMKAWACTP